MKKSGCTVAKGTGVLVSSQMTPTSERIAQPFLGYGRKFKDALRSPVRDSSIGYELSVSKCFVNTTISPFLLSLLQNYYVDL